VPALSSMAAAGNQAAKIKAIDSSEMINPFIDHLPGNKPSSADGP